MHEAHVGADRSNFFKVQTTMHGSGAVYGTFNQHTRIPRYRVTAHLGDKILIELDDDSPAPLQIVGNLVQ